MKLVNDHAKSLSGSVTLTLEDEQGQVIATAERPFSLRALGAQDVVISLALPSVDADNLRLRAVATPEDASDVPPTQSRRWVSLAD